MSDFEVGDFSKMESERQPEIVGWYPSWPKTLSNINTAHWYFWNPKHISRTHFFWWDGKLWRDFPDGKECIQQNRHWFGLRRGHD